MNINFYHNYFLNRKERYTPKYIVMTLIVLIIIMLLIFMPYSVNKIFNGQVIIQNEKYYVLIKIDYKDINKIKDKCIINDQEYKCKISKIDKSDNQYLILLSINLEEQYLIENYPIKIIFKKEQENLYQKIIKKRKDGLYENNR